ncbi:MAG: hypothetical protein ACJAZO_002610 [Myxococcota bacterium]|jgi:hypothetical protein
MRWSSLLALALLAGCPAEDTDTWPDANTDAPDPDDDSDTATSTTGFTEHCGEIVDDEVWRQSGNPHLLSCDVDLLEGTITIEPGVDVLASGSSAINISETGQRASLQANGTQALPIVFRPQEVEGEEDRWGGINVYTDADGVQLNFVEFQGSGGGFTPNSLSVFNNELAIHHLTITDALGVGVNLAGTSRLTADSTGLVVSDVTGYPATVSAEYAHTLPSQDSSYTGNGEDGPEVRAGSIGESVVWDNLGAPYVATGSINIEGFIDDPAILTLDAGTRVLFDVGEGVFLAPSGGEAGLVTNGTEEALVTLSALGADTGGFWRGIQANQGTTTLEFNHTVVSSGGRGLTSVSAIDIINSDVRVTNLTIRDSLQLGIALLGTAQFTEDSTGLTINGSTFPGIATSMTVSTIPDGSFIGNTIDAFQVEGNITRPTVWPKLDVPYWVDRPIFIDGYSDVPATLTIEPGTQVWFANNTRLEFGSQGGAAGLIAEGTVTEPILFTAAQFAERGAWDGIWFRDMCSEADVRLDHFTIEYGGGAAQAPYNLFFDACNPALVSNGDLRFSNNRGIGYIRGASPENTSNMTFSGNFVDFFCDIESCPIADTE